MVLRQREHTMSSEQPVKKKLRRTDEVDTVDEPDYIHSLAENTMRNDISMLHLSLPANVNEADLVLNGINTQLHNSVRENSKQLYEAGDDTDCKKSENDVMVLNSHVCVLNNINQNDSDLNLTLTSLCSNDSKPSEVLVNHQNSEIIQTNCVQPPLTSCTSMMYTHLLPVDVPLIPGSTNGLTSNHLVAANVEDFSCAGKGLHVTNHDRHPVYKCYDQPHSSSSNQCCIENYSDCGNCENNLDVFYKYLVQQCLCGISDTVLRKPFENSTNNSKASMLIEWPTTNILQFLSNLQLLFDVYLKQNNQGFVCARIVGVCNSLVQNEFNLIEQIIALCDIRNRYINYLSARVLSSFLIIAKTKGNNEWLETIVSYLTLENIDYVKMNFALEILKKVVEWKDVEIHVLEESHSQEGSSSISESIHYEPSCITVQFNDSESFDTSAIKGLTIKSLEARWPDLISKIHYLISHNNTVHSQTCILTFLSLWESIISVKANLSVIDTKPFYAHLENFVGLLNNNLPSIIWKQLLSVFNEVLCYGSTLALQDMLPEDTCQLAHLIVRYVKDFRLLDSLPYKCNDGYTINSFVGAISSNHPEQSVDKTLLQKMILLVLKSVAVTIKETRSDSSDSSVGSDDYDFYQDMQLIERSIRDVLMKVDVFVKSALEFHPETPFSKLVVNLFSDQDDYLIESMVCVLDFTVGISYRNALFPDLVVLLNPVCSFTEFLKVVAYDSDVLLDYLVSNETCFLLYLLRFLKYIRKNWSVFVNSCQSSGTHELENTMTVLIRLKTQINRLVSKELFPYNITPVIRLLDACENMYEGNEFS